MEFQDLPYRAEYHCNGSEATHTMQSRSKVTKTGNSNKRKFNEKLEKMAWVTGRGSTEICQSCYGSFNNGEMKLSAKIQSSNHDGKDLLSYHSSCFFINQRPRHINLIENFESLRYDDQKAIRDKLAEFEVALCSSSLMNQATNQKSVILGDFCVTNSAITGIDCIGCRSKIQKNTLRVKKTVYHTEDGRKFGGEAQWHHLKCFAKICGEEYKFFLCGDKLPGFESLSANDQEAVRKALPVIKEENLTRKKMRIDYETKSGRPPNQLEDLIACQTTQLFQIRDKLKGLTTLMLQEILVLNKSGLIDGEDLLDRCADFLCFGALAKCQKCLKGDMIFDKHGYRCNGTTDNWSVQCTNFQEKPTRLRCQIPDSLKENFPSAPTQDRAVRPKVKLEPISNSFVNKAERKQQPLLGMNFLIMGPFDHLKMKNRIEAMGGKTVMTFQGQIAAVISTPSLVENKNTRMQEVERLGIQVVPETFLDAVASGSDTVSSIKSMAISSWGSDPLARIPEKKLDNSKVTKVKLKNGAAIDPDSGLSNEAHVFSRQGVNYTTILGLTDIQKNKNSYFKIQVLQSDNKESVWLFSSWGRIGTTIGDRKLIRCVSTEIACAQFELLYLEKTGNVWNSGQQFEKFAGKFYPIEVDYEDMSEKLKLQGNSVISSKLSKPVQELVKMIFDIDAMKATMLEFQLDLERMPLGHISKNQLQMAYQTLAQLQQLLGKTSIREEFLSLSNKFYTLVPHNVGLSTLPVIDTIKEIKKKENMIDSLLEIEVAYSMLQKNLNTELNPVDSRFDQLNTKIEPLERSSKEFKLIEQYAANTHGETHSNFKLSILEVFKVERKGEAERYQRFKALHNRQLLWHGSRLTNFAGILSNGLKIAPPEAPATGQMFGKGIYFADMVSKSANYCFITPGNSTGLMLLSEVALGNCYELTQQTSLILPQNGFNSTKGVGRIHPDPTMSQRMDDGLLIPLGKPKTNHALQSNLIYNEYIVYDVAQVNIKYLVKMKFNFNR